MRSALRIGLGMSMVMLAVSAAIAWFAMRVYVPEDCCAVLIRKMGKTLPTGRLVATESSQRGIQEHVLGPGRYFFNPIVWDYELKPLLEIPAGDPSTWEWTHSLDEKQRMAMRTGTFKFQGKFPMIGVVTRRVGKEPPIGETIVSLASGMRGVLTEVLTPGTYRVNPYLYDVQLEPAVVIPSGFVGVVTNLFGKQPETPQTPVLPELRGLDSSGLAGTKPAETAPEGPIVSYVRPLANPGERGTVRDVLQPGVYFINPKLQKVTIIEIGFNEFSQLPSSQKNNMAISFPSDTGFLIQVGVTVVWGVDPRHAAEIINEFGNIDGVMDKVIGPQLRSICRNIGSTYAARDFIQGEKREQFQKDLTTALKKVCRAKNLEVLIALVRELEVHAPSGSPKTGEGSEDLKQTIQQSYIAIENQITKAKQREAAAIRAQLEEERKKVDIARETVRSQSRLLAANVMAEGDKAAAETEAAADLAVAAIQQEVALLDARRTEILGLARTDVDRMKNDSEAQGYEMLVNAFGGGQAYNLYTFAENFRPESIRLFFAGEGTFWTDLSRFQDLGGAKILSDAAGSK